MVFRGRPSRACHRCRARRLKCDFHPTCTPCIRANTLCPGYRAIPALRIQNETLSIQQKVRPSIETQAREVFFISYVAITSRGWDFVTARSAPDYLAYSLDAVSLAFLGTQRREGALLVRARNRYATALRLMNLAISPTAAKQSMLTASLLLDLFEKITHSGPTSESFWSAHINGSLALMQAVGFEGLGDRDSLRMLSRLSTNCVISCVASGTPVPMLLRSIRGYLETKLKVAEDPKWRLTGVMVEYASFRACHSVAECMAMAVDIEWKLQQLSQSMPVIWCPESIHGRLVYRDRHVTQAWNVIRLVRILLAEFLLEYDSRPECVIDIAILAAEICDSVPQYAECDCDGEHSPLKRLQCYSLLFPLYIAGRSKWISDSSRQWIVNQLQHIGSHFNIPNAHLLIPLLDTTTNPWDVYAMLGSYGFAA